MTQARKERLREDRLKQEEGRESRSNSRQQAEADTLQYLPVVEVDQLRVLGCFLEPGASHSCKPSPRLGP